MTSNISKSINAKILSILRGNLSRLETKKYRFIFLFDQDFLNEIFFILKEMGNCAFLLIENQGIDVVKLACDADYKILISDIIIKYSVFSLLFENSAVTISVDYADNADVTHIHLVGWGNINALLDNLADKRSGLIY